MGSSGASTAVGSAQITDGSIVNADVNAAAAIALSKLGITGTPDGTKFLKDDGSWSAPSGPSGGLPEAVADFWQVVGDYQGGAVLKTVSGDAFQDLAVVIDSGGGSDKLWIGSGGGLASLQEVGYGLHFVFLGIGLDATDVVDALVDPDDPVTVSLFLHPTDAATGACEAVANPVISNDMVYLADIDIPANEHDVNNWVITDRRGFVRFTVPPVAAGIPIDDSGFNWGLSDNVQQAMEDIDGVFADLDTASAAIVVPADSAELVAPTTAEFNAALQVLRDLKQAINV